MKKLIIIFAASLSLLGVGCKKGWLDVNVNPNRSTTATPEIVLPVALQSTAARFGNASGTFAFISGWVGYLAISGSYAISNNDFTTYKLTTDFGNGIWQAIYDNLYDYDYVEKNSTGGKAFMQGVAKIMKAYNFAYLVDLFNNIPYTEALQGTANIHPKYDDAATIYGDLFKQITAGMALIKNAAGDVPDAKSDIMFGKEPGSSRTNWQRFGNSLKLRLLLRMSEMVTKPAYFNSELAILVADPNGFLVTDATANPGYLNSAGKISPFYEENYNVSGTYIEDYWRAHEFAITFYNSHADPRLSRVYAPAASNGLYQGNVLGIQNFVGSASSTFGPGILKSFSQDVIVMLLAETKFEQAEAALRGWIPGNAQTLYQEGVTESFHYLEVPGYTTAAATYYNRANDTSTNYAATTTLLGRVGLILKQKWAALNMITPFEAYNDYRRFEYLHVGNYPFNTPAATPLGDLPLSQSPSVDIRRTPTRLLYPKTEIDRNPANVPTGINHHTSKIFWMR